MLGFANIALNFIPGLSFQPLLLVVGMMFLAIGFGEFSLPKSVSNLANATMGIYLVHVLFTSLANVVISKLGISSLPWIPAITILLILFVCSYVAVRFMPKWMRG